MERSDPEAILRTVIDMVKRRIPTRFHLDPVREVQVLCPMNRGLLGMRELNVRLQAELNPPRPDEAVDREVRLAVPGGRQSHAD